MTGAVKPLSTGTALLVTLAFVAVSDAGAGSPIILTNVKAETGISFRHTDGSSGRRYLIETVSAGMAMFDYDRDGDIDIYFLNGAPLKGTKTDTPPINALYRNDGKVSVHSPQTSLLMLLRYFGHPNRFGVPIQR